MCVCIYIYVQYIQIHNQVLIQCPLSASGMCLLRGYLAKNIQLKAGLEKACRPNHKHFMPCKDVLRARSSYQ